MSPLFLWVVRIVLKGHKVTFREVQSYVSPKAKLRFVRCKVTFREVKKGSLRFALEMQKNPVKAQDSPKVCWMACRKGGAMGSLKAEVSPQNSP